MARQFNMNTVFRSVDRTLLRGFFEAVGAEDIGGNWESIKSRDIEMFQTQLFIAGGNAFVVAKASGFAENGSTF